jgi:hypothetical protein
VYEPPSRRRRLPRVSKLITVMTVSCGANRRDAPVVNLCKTLSDQKRILFELSFLHLISHPTRRRTPSCPCELRIFLAAIFRRDFPALQRMRPSISVLPAFDPLHRAWCGRFRLQAVQSVAACVADERVDAQILTAARSAIPAANKTLTWWPRYRIFQLERLGRLLVLRVTDGLNYERVGIAIVRPWVRRASGYDL